MRVIVCGGRDYDDKASLHAALDMFHVKHPITQLIQGGATGADALAKDWATQNNVPQVQYDAAWADLDVNPVLIRFRNGKPYNALAGATRNQLMLDEQQPDAVIAFPGGKGTWDMLKRAYAAKRGTRPGLEVIEIKEEGYRK